MHEMQTIVTDVHVCPSVCRAAQLCVMHSCSVCRITVASCYFHSISWVQVTFDNCNTSTVSVFDVAHDGRRQWLLPVIKLLNFSSSYLLITLVVMLMFSHDDVTHTVDFVCTVLVWLNQAPLNLRGLIWLLMMDWSERQNIRKRVPSWEPFRKNSSLCSWQANQSWFKEKRNPQVPNRSSWGNRKKHRITVRDLLGFWHPHGGFHSTLVRNTRGFSGGWTMGPSAAWFYEGQLRLHRNWNWNPKP